VLYPELLEIISCVLCLYMFVSKEGNLCPYLTYISIGDPLSLTDG